MTPGEKKAWTRGFATAAAEMARHPISIEELCRVGSITLSTLKTADVDDFDASELRPYLRREARKERAAKSNPKRCSHRQPGTGIQCGMYAGHKEHPHTILTPTGAPWSGEKKARPHAR